VSHNETSARAPDIVQNDQQHPKQNGSLPRTNATLPDANRAVFFSRQTGLPFQLQRMDIPANKMHYLGTIRCELAA
jgi:hypothetical protein